MQQSVARHRFLTVGGWARLRLEAIAQWARGLWSLALVWFPVPSESKWRGMTELMGLFPQALLKEEALTPEALPDQEEHAAPREVLPQSLVARTLERMGDRWMRRRTGWLEGRPPVPAEVRMVLSLTFKTLDLPTTLRASGLTLKAVTARCPYIEQVTSDEETPRVCKALCSEAHSLFRGVAQGFPFHVSYRAPAMMGHGDPACVKVFRLMRPQRHEEADQGKGL